LVCLRARCCLGDVPSPRTGILVQLEQCVLLFLGPLPRLALPLIRSAFCVAGRADRSAGVLAHQLYEDFVAPSPWLDFPAV
jgi:hypothetical protein